MDMSLFLQTAVQMGTPLLFGTLGALLCEKVGHLNLGVEGMMLIGAVVGFSVGISTGSPILSLFASGLAGAIGALIFAFITVTLRGNHTVTGLVLTIGGTGFANYFGTNLVGLALPETISQGFKAIKIPFLSDIPLIGKALFNQSPYIYLSIFIAILMWFYMNKTTIGLNMRSIGENPSASDASGININLYKYIHIMLGGFSCGLGGAYLSLVFVPRWQQDITTGQGWIAVALVILASWNPLKAILGAYLFGALRGFGISFQNVALFGTDIVISSQLLDLVPYIMTIIALIAMTVRKKRENQPPSALGASYFREDR
ncbi:MAG: ABC transporter permease [Clostridia bacterium]